MHKDGDTLQFKLKETVPACVEESSQVIFQDNISNFAGRKEKNIKIARNLSEIRYHYLRTEHKVGIS